MKGSKGSIIRSMPLWLLETKFPDETLSVNDMVDLGLEAAPILWCYEGQYYLVPIEHVADILDAVKRHKVASKGAWSQPKISMADAIPLSYNVGYALSRRPR